MHEDGAAAILDARTIIIAEHNDDVVKSVFPPKPLAASCVRQGDRPIIVSIVSTVAPTIAFANGPYFERSSRPRRRIGPEIGTA